MSNIKSVQHPFVKFCVKIREDRNFRTLHSLVLVHGKKMVAEIGLQHKAHSLLLEEGESAPNIASEQIVYVTNPILKKITGVQTAEKIAALFPKPQETVLTSCSKILVLDQINDPGNLGTLIRTALAFGWEGVLFLGNCCDPFNEKALRASKGAIFRIPFQSLPLEELELYLKKTTWKWIGADLSGIPPDNLQDRKKIALVIGSESHGISPQTEKLLHTKVSLPMSQKMESLNAAIAGGILMYLLQ